MDIIHAMRQIHNVYHIGKKVVNKLRARSSSHLGKRIDKLHQKMNRSGLSDKRLSRLQKKSDNLTKKKDKLDKKVSKFEKKQNKTSPFAKLKEKRRESKLRRRNHRRDKFRNMIENSRFGQSKLGKKVLKKVGKARRAQLKALEKLAQMLQKIMQAIAKLKETIATIGKYILLAIVIIILVVLLIK
jgi:predicted nuclease with TOPRIM domain